MKNISILISLLCLSLFVQASVEYACWESNQMPGMAFEATGTECNDGTMKSVGTISETTTGDKKIVCMMPASCIALSPSVIRLLRNKLGVEKAADLTKFTTAQIRDVFTGTPYFERNSFLQCEGKGKILPDMAGSLTLMDAKCPTVSECANSQQVSYNMNVMSIPTTLPAGGLRQPDVKAIPQRRR